jgi:phosphoglycerate dehydrogenase-like enzyme
VMARAQRLRWIHQTGAGISHLLPLDWLPDHVVLTNSRGVHEQKAGEFAACALLMLNNLIPIYVTNQRKQRWVQEFNDPIDGRTVVVVGVGHMGSAAARRARQLGLRVIGVRRSDAAHPDFDAVHPVEHLHDTLPEADFLLVTAPLTTGTEGLIGAAELDLLKPTAGLINMARARIVDYEALAERLRTRRLRGAILDVFDPEPLAEDSPLWHCDNLIISPHASSDSLDYSERVLAVFVDNLRRLRAGQPLRNRIDPATAY